MRSPIAASGATLIEIGTYRHREARIESEAGNGSDMQMAPWFQAGSNHVDLFRVCRD
jgi:hypothetical protein